MLVKTKQLLSFLFAILAANTMWGQYDMKAPMPVDSAIRMGKLANGISYYVRHNEYPKDRADFYIIQNVGALLEEDHQNGLAHFLEHMAFNGTANFPGKGIIKTLERHGIAFGQNINAYTAQNETIYYLNDIVSTDKALLDTCLMVLHDWSHYLTLSEEEIDNERGVIAEEWRTRRNASKRLSLQYSGVLFEGSKYAERDVIGSLEIINHFRPQTLRDFYHDWYRTDLQAIVVVGDIDAEEMVKKITTLFSSIPAVENPMPRPVFTIPARKDIGYVCATDKEVANSSVSLYMIEASPVKNDHQAFKKAFTHACYNFIISSRIAELIRNGDPNLMNASVVYGDFVRGYKAFKIYAGAKPNKEKEAFEAIYTEVERMRRFGITQTELERFKKSNLAHLEDLNKNLDKRTNSSFVEEIQEMFLTGDNAVAFEYEYPLAKEMIRALTVEEVSALAKKLPAIGNEVFIVMGPPEGVKHVTKEELLSVKENVRGAVIEDFVDAVSEAPLFNEPIEAGKIVKEKKLKLMQAEEWILSNGAKVVYAKTDYKKDHITFNGVSYGGYSLEDVKRLPAAMITDQVVRNFGLAGMDATALSKSLAGVRASTTVSINEFFEEVSGGSVAKDVEKLFQMAHLRFTQPRFDEQAFKIIMERTGVAFVASKGKPQTIMQDSLSLILNDYHPRTVIMNEDLIKSITIEDVEKVYRERIRDASDFTFFIVGDIEKDILKPLVEKYLCSIPSVYRKEKWRDNKIRNPKGRTQKEIILPFETPKATVRLSFYRKMKKTPRNTMYISVLRDILSTRYTDTVREKEGGTYGVTVRAGASNRPIDKYSMTMQFDCDPAKASYLKQLVYDQLESVKAKGVTQDEIDNVVKNILKEHEQNKVTNAYVISTLVTYYYLDKGVDNSNSKNYEDILTNIKPVDIQKFAQKLFGTKADVVDLVFTSGKD